MTRILIVDDKMENAYLLRALLQGHGYAVEEARHGAEALDKARQHPPAMIVSDLLMPVMDGYTLLRQWRADSMLERIPFVVYTATYTEPKDEQLALDLGADAFMIKPAEPEVILARLQEVLAACAQGQPPRKSPTAKEDNVLLKQYNEALVRRLENKMAQLEQSNRKLEQDIAARQKVEAELRRVDRARRAISACNQILFHAADETSLLRQICEVVVEQGGHRFAWVGLSQDEAFASILPAAQAGHEAGYLEKIKAWQNPNQLGHTPIGQAIRNGQPCLVRNITVDPLYAHQREAALKCGFASAIFLPLMDKNRPLGALCIYANIPDAFDAEEIRLLGELALDLAYGVLTLRQRAAHQLSEERIHEQAALLDAANDAIYVSDLESKVLYWNGAAERMYGYNNSQVLGRNFHELLRMDAPSAQTAVASLVTQGCWAGEREYTAKSGKILAVLCRWTLLRDSHGQPRKLLAIDTDITEKKLLEANFYRVQRLEGIGSLASGIAHDLNNILSPLLSITPMLRGSIQDADGQSMLEIIENSARRGAEIIRLLLAFARGKPSTRIPLPTGTLLRDIEKIVYETFPRDICLRLDSPEDLWPMIGDGTQIQQVLMNLCINSRDAMPGGGTLNVGARNVRIDTTQAATLPGAQPGQYVRVTVADTGTGIAPEHMNRIFDPFFSTKDPGKGTGLGLPTVLGIVRGHGGFVHVESHIGRGTIFEVYFPANPPANGVLANYANARPTLAGQGEWILAALSNHSELEKLCQILEKNGYRTAASSDGAEALAMFSRLQAEIRVVVADMQLPSMDGSRLLRAMRTIVPQIPVIGLTASPSLHRAPYLPGLTCQLNKPIDPEEMLAALRQALLPAQPTLK